ncbi:adrenocorticotropic hormone receptor-like [Dendronephthya gigantea]|uniref:adrenocorticotropic hormone receptor-like n=1 Tax=Dendronephthya gigantea TaxID=151771 RepID=UPI00106A9E78|nr:adrenocorticotropic hormone receptor-like [Dendronephthya gigantea]
MNEINNTTHAGQLIEPDKVVPSLVVVIGVASVVFNGALLIVMTFNSKQVFASLGSYFIFNLAIADFVTGVNSIVWGIERLSTPGTFSKEAGMTLLTIFWITVQVSFFTIFVMSTERLVAIVFPFKAALLMSKKKTTVYCIAVWIFAIVCAGLMNFKINQVQLFLTILFEVIIICIAIEYYQVFRQLRSLWQSSKNRAVYNGHNNNEAGNKMATMKSTDLKREYEVTIVVVTLAVILVVTVIPYMIANQVILGYDLFNKPDHPAMMFSTYYFPIELLNFVVDPVVYAWRLPKYRKAFLATFSFGKDRNFKCSTNGSPKTLRTTCPTEEEGQVEMKKIYEPE